MKPEERLANILEKRRCTHLGIGPMSRNCVDAAVELANELDLPIMLIASRRQVEAAELGGGYVENWTTESFSRYVKERDKKGNIILARDHGGPWQNYSEVKEKMNLREAMASAKRSFEIDIASGFEMLHIDPSIDIHKPPSREEVLERLFELYEYCWRTAQEHGAEPFFEFGTDEQSGDQENLEEFEELVKKILRFCSENKLPKPFFVVVQTGTKVKETRNIGNLDSAVWPKGIIPPKVYVHKLVEICERHGLRLKEHNADYLSDEILQWHPRVGIHGINVAPEFGVVETRSILRICDDFGLTKEKEKFLELAYNSKKWDKWLVRDSAATDEDKAVIAGHYVFSAPEFLEVKNAVASECRVRGFDLNFSLKQSLKHSIMKYIHNLNLHHGFF